MATTKATIKTSEQGTALAKKRDEVSIKNTLRVKTNTHAVYEMLGGIKAHYEWAKDNPDKFYDQWFRTLPVELKAEIKTDDGFATILEQGRLRAARIQATAEAEPAEFTEVKSDKEPDDRKD